MDHDAGTDYLPVYHTTAQAHALHFGDRDAALDGEHDAGLDGERDAPLGVDWVGFARAVLAVHRPDGDECAGCGRAWACCPVTVAARQHGLRPESPPRHGIRHAVLG